MILRRISLLFSVASVIISAATADSNSGSGGVFLGINGSDSGATQYLPVEVLQNQLLNTSGTPSLPFLRTTARFKKTRRESEM